MARRGFGVSAQLTVGRAKKRTKKSDAGDLTLEELQAAEYESGVPLEPLAARLFRTYRSLADAIGEFAASSKPPKASKSEESEPSVKLSPTKASDFLVPYSAGRTKTIRTKLSKLSQGLVKGKGDLRKIVTFLRGINRELEKAIDEPIPWSLVPDAECVEMIQTGPGGSLDGLTASRPPDLGEQLRKKGEIAGLVEVWTRVGELVLIYERPKKFFETCAPDLTPMLFDPEQLNWHVERPGTLQRCLFVWGPSALLNPVVREAFDRAARHGKRFQEVITTATGRTAYKEGGNRSRHGRGPETKVQDRRRNRLVEAITYLGGESGNFDPVRFEECRQLLKTEGCWPDVAPLVGTQTISHARACRIVAAHLGISVSAIKKSCSYPDEA